MTVTERNRQLRVVAELLLVHLPEVVNGDQPLAHDLLAVAGAALRAVYDDSQQSAKAWDKRAYDVKADRLRREWDWALGASNYATGLALRPEPVTPADLRKLRALIQLDLERPYRRQITDVARFRGAAQAVRQQQSQKRRPVRG
ncbi:MAG: hypothetical protein JXB35_11715 [Anaerolineae bacterium]|nr:hypothetical protein [Anaerolineae bacterium]